MNIKEVFLYGVGALALIALAGPFPDAATMLALILIAGVVLANAQDYANLISGK